MGGGAEERSIKREFFKWDLEQNPGGFLCQELRGRFLCWSWLCPSIYLCTGMIRMRISALGWVMVFGVLFCFGFGFFCLLFGVFVCLLFFFKIKILWVCFVICFPPPLLQVWSNSCAQPVLGGGGWWTSAVFHVVIQVLKTSCPVLPCLTKCCGGAVWPLLTPFLKCWCMFKKRSLPALEVGTAFAFCFQKRFVAFGVAAEEGLEGMAGSA